MRWVRPVIVLFLSVAVSFGFFTERVNTEAFMAFATGLIVYWFRSRDIEKRDKP